MSLFLCGVCGHVAFGSAPGKCPVCGAATSAFSQNDNLFTEAAEKSREAAVKHIPAVTVNRECGLIPGRGCVDIIVRIGETLHPMEAAHHISFIDCYVDDAFVSRVQLTPGVYAAGCFHLKAAGSKVRVVEKCNVHGHWQAGADIGCRRPPAPRRFPAGTPGPILPDSRVLAGEVTYDGKRDGP